MSDYKAKVEFAMVVHSNIVRVRVMIRCFKNMSIVTIINQLKLEPLANMHNVTKRL
jgi:hypothetical protein